MVQQPPQRYPVPRDPLPISNLMDLRERVLETRLGVLFPDMLANTCVGRVAEARFREEAGGGRGPDVNRDVVFAEGGDESGFGGAGDGVVVELVDGGFYEVVGGAEGDDEVDFGGLVVGDAEVGEFAGLVVVVDGTEGRKDGAGPVWPVEVEGVDGWDFERGERCVDRCSDLFGSVVAWKGENLGVNCGPGRDIGRAKDGFTCPWGTEKGMCEDGGVVTLVLSDLLGRVASSGVYAGVAVLAEDIQEFLGCFWCALADYGV